MPKFRDSDGYDPYRTDPLWESEEPFDYVHDVQLPEDEVIQPNSAPREQGDRNDKRKNQRRAPCAMQDGPEGPGGDFAEKQPNSSPNSSHEISMRFVDFLIPPINPKPETIRRYRLGISIAITLLFLITGASYGVFKWAGVDGFAHSEIITVKIEDATHPLKEEIVKQTQLLKLVSMQLTDQLAAGTATEIREKTIKRCLEKDRSERERIYKDIDRLQDLYFEYKQKYYEYRLTRYEDQACWEL